MFMRKNQSEALHKTLHQKLEILTPPRLKTYNSPRVLLDVPSCCISQLLVTSLSEMT